MQACRILQRKARLKVIEKRQDVWVFSFRIFGENHQRGETKVANKKLPKSQQK